MVNECSKCKDLRRQLAFEKMIACQVIDIICDPNGGLYERIATYDARIRRLVNFARKQREELNEQHH